MLQEQNNSREMRLSLTKIIAFSCLSVTSMAQQEQPVYQSKTFSIFSNEVRQGNYTATALSSTSMTSDYRSPDANRYPPTLSFKFSINSRDNEMISGKDHHVTLRPVHGQCVTNVQFGKQYTDTRSMVSGINLLPNTHWTIRLDMREVIKSFNEKGYYVLYNGERIDKSDFKGVYIAGSAAPLIWDFNNLRNHPELELKDPDGDGVYETTLVMNKKSDEKHTAAEWKLSRDITSFPQYKSDYPLSDALYNLSLEEMVKAIEPDSTFRTGKEWAGVWTRDISYSIILAMAHLQPRVAKYSLLRKVKNDRIIQDTGTGGAYPVSSDRIVWTIAAWELYKVTGDREWLQQAYKIVRNSVEDDLKNIYDPATGLMRGESSFLDWREQTYPRWMQPADIYESENLGTNAVHYQAIHILSQMALLLNEPAASKYEQIAAKIKQGINTHLWMKDKGYYAQYLYGRNFQSLSPRSEALGEALCVWFGIADEKQQKSIIEKAPVMNYGIPCIYPQIPDIPPYHNNAVWPFVEAYWGLASAKVGNERSVLEAMATIYRSAALFLTNKENFVASTGDFAGTQINSDNMLWSLSGNLALVHKILFGIEFRTDSLLFHPFVPKVLQGKHSLSGFKYRNATLNIEMTGFGNVIRSFELDGKLLPVVAIPASLHGTHLLRIILGNRAFSMSAINKRSNYITPETPVVKYTKEHLVWNKIQNAKSYTILKNGIKYLNTTSNTLPVSSGTLVEYQIMAVDHNGISSFASEPIAVVSKQWQRHFEMEDFAPKAPFNYKNYRGTGFVESSKTINRSITIPVDIAVPGTYSIDFRYANGNGPVNTENKCAIRTLRLGGIFAGTIVLPQRGLNEWSNWGQTNCLQVRLSKGHHELTLTFEPQNENMNNDINQAMIDSMSITFLSK